MSKEDIIRKAIAKAEENGWVFPFGTEKSQLVFLLHYPELFIFSHDFAKAFFPEETKTEFDSYEGFNYEHITTIDWQHHLQQMVLEKEPLKYLEKFLKTAK